MDLKPRFVLIGTGGFGRETIEFAPMSLYRAGRQNSAINFAVEGEPECESVSGYPVFDLNEICKARAECYFNIAIADSAARERISRKCFSAGLRPLSLVHETSIVSKDAQVGEGAILSAFSIITSNAQIGRFFQCNIFSYVAHDCVIGDFVTFAPRVSCNGNIVIEDHAYIGTGAVIRNGARGSPLVIGRGAVVGMGSIVTKSIEPGQVVVGNPARPRDS